jgi:predicted RNase H-like HicB family nuclease
MPDEMPSRGAEQTLTGRVGPHLTLSCAGCLYAHEERYAAQGDSGCDVYCLHPALGRRFVADTAWKTPGWCPVMAVPSAPSEPVAVNYHRAATDPLTGERIYVREPAPVADRVAPGYPRATGVCPVALTAPATAGVLPDAFEEGPAGRAPELLKLPYARLLTPDPRGGFTGEIREFPGCVVEGATVEAAYAALEEAARAWIEAAEASGFKVPLPQGDGA